MLISRAGTCNDSNELHATSCKLRKYQDSLFVTRHLLLNSCRGFTLLEIIVVIFIISLALAIVFPSFIGIGESRIKSEAKRLASVIRYLNDTSISTKETVAMKFNFRDKALSYKAHDEEKAERFDSVSNIELQSKGLVSDGEVIIFFGLSGAQESFKFYLKDDKSAMEVTMNAMNGKVKVATSDKQRDDREK